MFENPPKFRIWGFKFWHFSPIFDLFGNTVWPEASDFQKNSQKWTIFGIFNWLLSTQNVNVARFARNVGMRLFMWYSNTVLSSNWVVKLCWSNWWIWLEVVAFWCGFVTYKKPFFVAWDRSCSSGRYRVFKQVLDRVTYALVIFAGAPCRKKIL